MNRLRRLKIALPATAGVVLTLYLVIAFAMVYLATRPERKPFEGTPEAFGLRYREVTFTPRSDDDLVLRGWLIEGVPEAPYLIFVHGIGDQRTGNQSLELAARLVDEGYNVLLFDLRAQGTSDGSFVSAGDFERYDVLGAYDFLLGQGAEPGRVGLVGRSYGAATAIMAAALEPGITAVVADSPFADVQDRISKEAARKTPMPEGLVGIFLPPTRLFADLFYGIHLGSLRPERDVAKLAYPVLIIHGEADERIPISESRRVYEAAPAGSEFWTLPGVTHADGFPAQPDEYLRHLSEYLSDRFHFQATEQKTVRLL